MAIYREDNIYTTSSASSCSTIAIVYAIVEQKHACALDINFYTTETSHAGFPVGLS